MTYKLTPFAQGRMPLPGLTEKWRDLDDEEHAELVKQYPKGSLDAYWVKVAEAKTEPKSTKE